MRTRKHLLSFVIVPIIILPLLLGCEEDIDLVSDSAFTPVVYCMLNPEDSVHYLRIGRTYIFEGNANSYKPVYDSLIYPEEFSAYLTEKGNQGLGKEIVFESSELFKKDSGFFDFGPCQVYQIKSKIVSGREYSLFVHSEHPARLIAAKIKIIKPIRIIEPVHYPGKTVTLLPDQSLELQWAVKATSLVCQGFLRIKYLEGNKDFQMLKEISYQLPPVKVSNGSEQASTFLNGQKFMNYLKSMLPAISSNNARKLVGFDFEMWAGGPELALFYSSNNEEDSPIGSISDYSNIDGGAGLFSSRVHAVSKNNEFSDLTQNYLAESESTKQLGFLKYGEDFK